MQYTLIFYDANNVLDYAHVDVETEIEEITCRELATIIDDEVDDEEHWAETLFGGDGPYVGFAYIPGHVEVNIP